jgi:hypothetical protein
MFDDLNPRARRDGIGRTPGQQPPRDADALTDREVPLDSNMRLSSAVHAWLDGDASESSLQLSDATEKQVELWKRINSEATVRRQVTTPVYVQQRIMSALPEAAPARALPWWRQTMSLNPVAIAAAAAGLIAAGAAIGISLFAR